MRIVVPEEKIVNYLLSEKSKGKNQFFLMFGYTLENWAKLRDDIFELGKKYPRTLKREIVYGKKYEIIGEITAPNGRKITIKTGWFIANDDPETLRFVTAYPV